MEFINKFFKGLTSDVNIVMQPEGTWRFMKNCNVISQDGNNYTIKDCLGNVRLITINAPYNGDLLGGVADLPMCIGFISFPDELIVFSTNNQASGGYLEIGKVEWKPYGEGIQANALAGQYHSGYIPLYHHISLNATWKHRIEGFAFIENELIRRVYWTDNYNQPRVFNVSDPIYTTYISSGSLVNGTTYMVLEGAITYDGDSIDYAPGFSAGNIFTAGATNTYTALTITPTPKIIVYSPYQLLDFTPERTLGCIQYSSYGASGGIYCGNKIYFYRLSSSQGIVTTWSYGSFPIHVGDQNDYTTSVAYHNFVGAGSATTLVNSGKSVNVQIDNIDTNFEFLELACAEFDQSAETIRQITIVNKVAITGATMIVNHSGNSNLGNLTIDDITLFPASILTAKTITTNKNFILLANTTERQEFGLDTDTLTTNVTISSFEYPMLVHADPTSCSLGGMIYDTCAPSTSANPVSGTIKPWERFTVVSGGTVEYPVGSGTFYAAGEYFTGTVGNTTYNTTGTPVIRPCVARNKYTTFSGDPRPNIIQIQGTGGVGYWDYKEPAVHHHCAGLWSNEIYRWAAVVFDKKGNPFYARHLADYQMPDANTKGGLIRSDAYGAVNVYSLNPSGVRISGLTFTSAQAAEMSGFAIMRAVRDPRIVSQGLVTQCTTDGASPPTYYPGGWIPISEDNRAEVMQNYVYLCPDKLVGFDPTNAMGEIGDKMEEACWIEPFDYGAGIITRGSGPAGSEQVYVKIIEQLPTDGVSSARTKTITYWGEMDEGEALTNIDSAGTVFTNEHLQTGGAGVNVEGACVTAGVDYNLTNRNFTGCKKCVFQLDSDFLHYSQAVLGYTDPATDTQIEKILMNYVKAGVDSSTLYGGQGEDALANTLYISTGHFQPFNSTVLTEVFNGTNCVFNDIEVFGGDCFTSLIDIGYGLWNNAIAPTFSYAWTFPCECNTNYGLRRGRKTSTVEMYYTGTASSDSIVFDGPIGETNLEDYSYNPGYSSVGGAIAYPALPVNFINAGQFQARIRWAGQKILGEIIDSFRNFGLLDFRDISAQNGRINNLKVVNDTVVVMQDKAINTVPVLERQVVSSASGQETTIGTGGVVTRWDVLSNDYGNQHQWSVVETAYGLAWFDMIKKCYLILSKGQGILEVSQIYGLKGFFDEVFLEAIGVDVISTANLLNSPTLEDTSDQPLMGVGITGVYDPKLKMTYHTFKFKARKVLAAGDAYKSSDFTIGYYHSDTGKFFVGFYDWFPAIAHNHNQVVFSMNNPKTTTQFIAANIANTVWAVGDTLQGQTNAPSYTNEEYICIAAVTLDNAVKYPLGSSGATYWAVINRTNELWVNNQPEILGLATALGYQYNSFFGRVVDNEYDIVVNPQPGESFFVRAIEQHGPYNVNATTITTSGALLSATDANIRGTDTNYKFVFNKIMSNLPLTSKGARIIDEYLNIKFIKKNWSTVPTTITTSVKILRFIKSFFELKK